MSYGDGDEEVLAAGLVGLGILPKPTKPRMVPTSMSTPNPGFKINGLLRLANTASVAKAKMMHAVSTNPRPFPMTIKLQAVVYALAFS